MRFDASEPQPPGDTVQAWTNLLRTPLPHLHPETFRALHPVRVDQADTATLLRIQPSQEVRHLGVKLKHNANSALVDGKSIVLVDDSIVRGTTSVKLVQMMRDAETRTHRPAD